MSDPVDQLSRFGSDLETVPVPLPAAEVRRRGDRRRHRTAAVRSGIAALAVAAVVVPTAVIAGHGNGTPAPGPATHPDSAGPVRVANLITDADTSYPGAHWVAYATSPGDGQAQFMPCARSSMGSLGATAIQSRDFELYRSSGEVGGAWLGTTVASFPDAAAAKRARVRIESWVERCSGSTETGLEQDYTVRRPQVIDAAVPGEAELYTAHAKASGLPGRQSIQIGLVRSGDRLAVVSMTLAGVDVDQLSGSPMETMTAKAGHDLVLTGKDAASTYSSTQLGPEGYAGLRLGQDYDSVMATGQVTTDRYGSYRLVDPADASLCLSRKGGLMAIWAGTSLRTPEDIGVGTPYRRLRRTYPNLEPRRAGQGIYTVSLGKDRYYEFDVEQDGTISEFVLKLGRQTCFE